MRFKIEDDKQTLLFDDSVSSDITLQLKNQKIRKIGKLGIDGDLKVYLSRKDKFTYRKLRGFSINFSLLSYTDRIDILDMNDNNKLYRISKHKALVKGASIYESHRYFENQLFIPLKYFILYENDGTKWAPKK